MEKNRFRFWILVCIVAVSGFSQGMLLPLIAVIFESSGVSSFLNGLNATGLYIGVLLVSPFMEQPLRRFGYKPLLIFGGLLVLVSLALFPLWQSFWFWFILRLFIGIGDHALNFGAQTWISSFSPKKKRGRNIAIYGLFFGIGFAVGPLMVSLVNISESLPFILASCLSLIGWLFLFALKNELPEQDVQVSSFRNTFKRFKQAAKYAWVAFLPPFTYGFLETSLNGNFPVYALRIGIPVENVSAFLFAFAIGAIIFQLPLGMLSDRFGRKQILSIVLLLGFICFSVAGIVEHSFYGLFICLLLVGMFVGSMFSLGITYMTDLTPQELLPTGNLLCGVFFSFGSLIGPSFGGLFIEFMSSISFFYFISAIFLIIFIILVGNGKKVEA
ncbi:MFS transporter [Gracilibacillus sp. S3-1-1]|uniref:MFS transporter n=1 Tax=Gracilibacillus pellucidus TaxID=3095368 RepID=A0ACC6M4S7_9BACI|nr:MFS transporter [Gracilibacillus sp. S3-1-1]MDX8045911.1 MFS transporter [Gracilibacillus sp. S3-1-1]